MIADANNTLDGIHELYSDGKDIYLIYTDSDETIPDDADKSSFAVHMGLTVGKFGKETKTFKDFTRISVPGKYVSDFSIETVNGVPTVVWVQSGNSDSFGQHNENEIAVSRLINGKWSSPEILASGMNVISDIMAGTVGGKETILYVHDNDGQLSTCNDLVLESDAKIHDLGTDGKEIIYTESTADIGEDPPMDEVSEIKVTSEDKFLSSVELLDADISAFDNDCLFYDIAEGDAVNVPENITEDKMYMVVKIAGLLAKVTLFGGDEEKSFDKLSEAFAYIAKNGRADKDYEICVSVPLTAEKALTAPGKAKNITITSVGEGSITAKCDLTLDCPVNSAKKAAINVAKGKTLTFKAPCDCIGTIKGTNTSSLVIDDIVEAAAVNTFGKVNVAGDAELIINEKGKMSGISEFDGPLTLGKGSSAAITAVNDAVISMERGSDGALPKLSVSSVRTALDLYCDTGFVSGEEVFTAGKTVPDTKKISIIGSGLYTVSGFSKAVITGDVAVLKSMTVPDITLGGDVALTLKKGASLSVKSGLYGTEGSVIILESGMEQIKGKGKISGAVKIIGG